MMGLGWGGGCTTHHVIPVECQRDDGFGVGSGGGRGVVPPTTSFLPSVSEMMGLGWGAGVGGGGGGCTTHHVVPAERQRDDGHLDDVLAHERLRLNLHDVPLVLDGRHTEDGLWASREGPLGKLLTVCTAVIVSVPAPHISEGAAPSPYCLAPCPIYTAPCPNWKKHLFYILFFRDARYTAVTGIPRCLGVPVRTAVRFLNTGIPRHQMIEV